MVVINRAMGGEGMMVKIRDSGSLRRSLPPTLTSNRKMTDQPPTQIKALVVCLGTNHYVAVTVGYKSMLTSRIF